MRQLAVLAALAAVFVCIGPAEGAAPPVGSLPKSPTSRITTTKGALVSIAMPSRAGKSWRLARAVDSRVLVEIGEANVGKSVVVVFRAVGRGSVLVAYGLTRGERPKAYAAARYAVTVS